MVGPNPAGLLALEQYRPRFYFGGPGQRKCVARSRRTGQPCRAVPMRGKKVCRHHGGHSNGRGVKKRPEKRNERQQRNFGVRHARALAAKDMENRQLHPETMQVFSAQYAGRVAPSDLSLFLLSLDNYLTGNMDRRAWIEALGHLRI